jgi:putative ABC transport system substrate-binding protein
MIMKKNMKKLASISLAACMVAGALAACGGSSTTATTAAATTAAATEAATTAAAADTTAAAADTTAAAADDGKEYKIGVLQLVQHVALDASNKGFIQALDESGIKYTADQQNASGEQSACQTIAEKFVNDGVDLIYTIATPATEAAAAATTDIPIVLAAVTDPEGSGLVQSNEKPGVNITGASDLTPVKEQIELLKKLLPDAKTVGILYCSAESNSEIQAQMARDACDAQGLAHDDYTVSSTNEIQTVVESMIGKVDAIYCPTDNTIAAGMATVAQVANDNKIPTICGEGGMVDNGGLATYGIDYTKLGYMAGKMAVEILTEGKNPADMPIQYESTEECELQVNEDTAKLLGIDTSVLK